MLKAGFLFPVEESDWISPIVIQGKKIGGICVCVDFRGLNEACMHDPFPMSFCDEILDKVTGNEAYSFMDDFSGYHQICIAEEDKSKPSFATEWGSYAYNVMPFGLKNSPAVFSRVVVVAFRDYIHKFVELYLDDWTVYSMLKDHAMKLRLMLDKCWQMQLSCNINKCLFCTAFGVLLGRIVCKEGLLVDPAKVSVIVNLPAPEIVSTLRSTLGHTRYYCRFLRGYVELTTPMEDLLRKGVRSIRARKPLNKKAPVPFLPARASLTPLELMWAEKIIL